MVLLGIEYQEGMVEKSMPLYLQSQLRYLGKSLCAIRVETMSSFARGGGKKNVTFTNLSRNEKYSRGNCPY